jgi:hypothetical protein
MENITTGLEPFEIAATNEALEGLSREDAEDAEDGEVELRPLCLCDSVSSPTCLDT